MVFAGGFVGGDAGYYAVNVTIARVSEVLDGAVGGGAGGLAGGWEGGGGGGEGEGGRTGGAGAGGAEGHTQGVNKEGTHTRCEQRWKAAHSHKVNKEGRWREQGHTHGANKEGRKPTHTKAARTRNKGTKLMAREARRAPSSPLSALPFILLVGSGRTGVASGGVRGSVYE